MNMLRAKNIVLRAIEERDLPLIASWRNEPEMYEYFYEYAPLSLKKQQAWYTSQMDDPSQINFVVATTEGNAIGTISIYKIDYRNRKAEWGRLIIEKNSRRSGIGICAVALCLQYAFEHLNLHRLYCEVLENNTTAIALYEKSGFKTEGVLRDNIFKSGRYINALTLSMLDTDYFHERQHGKLADFLD